MSSPKTQTKPVQIRDRDRAIFRLLHKFRVLRTKHFIDVLGMSRQVANRRLKLLESNKYISWVDPMKEQGIDTRTQANRSENLYCLSARGAKHLRDRTEYAVAHSNPETKAGRDHVSHHLLIADFLIAVESACLDMETVRFVPSEEILAGSKRLQTKKPYKVEAPIEQKEGGWKPKTIYADGLFGLAINGEPRPRYFFFEADRGTMPGTRVSSPDQTHLRAKYATYYEFRRRKFVQDVYGFDRYAVLFLTDDNQARVMSALAAANTVRENNPSWFFADKSIFEHSAGDILRAPWVQGNGQSIFLIQQQTQPTPRPTAAVN